MRYWATTIQQMAGLCHVFAIALHRAFGFKFLILTDKNEMYKGGVPAVHHVYAVDNQGNAYDFNGKHPASNITQQWLHIERGSWHRPGVVQVSTEKGLSKFVSDDWDKPLDSYTNQDVKNALDVAMVKLSDVLPKSK
jgi:hypothetical protein